MKLNKGCTLVLWLLVATLFVATAIAQETTAGMQGTVKDPQGAVVSKAIVEVSSPALIGVKKVETDASGYYRFSNLPPGPYAITVTAQGFRTLKQSGINLEVGKLPTIDLSLQIGGAEQTVEVSSEAPVIDVTVTKTQTNVTAEMISAAPQGRSFQSAINFAPGARQEPLQGSGFSVAGAAQTENQYLIEGQDTGDVINGASKSDTPFEFIQEVTVKSSGIEAEHAGALGGVINVIQKRGGNAWHGQFWTYYEPNAVEAAPSQYSRQDPTASVNDATRTDVPAQVYQPKKDKYLYVQPGVEVGGPIVKDRLWMFLGFAPQYYKRDRTVDMDSLQTTVYTPDHTIGPTKFSRHEETYYTTARLDYLATSKIRLFGSWLYQYWRATGINMPNADDVFGLVNMTARDPMGKYLASMSEVNPNQLFNVGADITITPSLVATARYGHSFQNDGYRGFPNAAIYWWRADGTSATLPDNVTPVGGILGTQGYLASNYPTAYIADKDASKKDQLTGDLAWFKKAFGTHNFKFGYQMNRLENDANIRSFDSLVRLFAGRPYKALSTDGKAVCSTIAADMMALYPGLLEKNACRGTYGYAVVREYATLGDLASYNNGIYAQDAWTLGKGLTLNVGFRIDKEYLPADPVYGLPNNRGIDFGWGDKFAPRFGAAWDVFQNGKMKVFGSYGMFFDQMKLGLARGSFGGEYWHDCIYALNTNDPTTIVPQRTGGGNHYCDGGATSQANLAGTPDLTFIENIDYRQGATAGEEVDPDLKPYRQHESVLGVDYQLFKNWAFEARWDRRRVDKAIEDAGSIVNGSEIFTIVNPGYGTNAAVAGCATCPALPKAIRDYDGVEFRLTKSMSQHWFGQFSYTWSRLWGNYSGLTSSDVSDGGTGGRLDPNANRAFDEAYFMFDAYGKPSDGLLATDRPHAFKAYGYYSLPWANKRFTSNIGLMQTWFSGTPLSSYMDVAYNSGSAPVFVEGRAKWVDITTDAVGNWSVSSPGLRRTDAFSQTDLRFSQDFRISKNNEAQVLGFEADITNLFNQRVVTAYTSQMNTLNNTGFLNVGADCGVTDDTCNTNPVILQGYDWKNMVNGYKSDGTGYPTNALYKNSLYGQPLSRQDGRTVRFKIRYNW